jgi:hypothetical protein
VFEGMDLVIGDFCDLLEVVEGFSVDSSLYSYDSGMCLKLLLIQTYLILSMKPEFFVFLRNPDRLLIFVQLDQVIPNRLRVHIN